MVNSDANATAHMDNDIKERPIELKITMKEGEPICVKLEEAAPKGKSAHVNGAGEDKKDAQESTEDEIALPSRRRRDSDGDDNDEGDFHDVEDEGGCLIIVSKRGVTPRHALKKSHFRSRGR
jgi:hypothetical protein